MARRKKATKDALGCIGCVGSILVVSLVWQLTTAVIGEVKATVDVVKAAEFRAKTVEVGTYVMLAVVGTGLAGGGNPISRGVGPAMAAIRSALEQALEGVDRSLVRGNVIGAAGFGSETGAH